MIPKTVIKTLLPVLIGLLSATFFTGCEDNGANPGEGTEKGYASGRVTDTQGKPIEGAKVVIDNTMIYNSSLVVITDAAGRYRVKLPTVGTFAASATIVKPYNGKSYTMSLHPDNPEPFSVDGAVRNFQWKLTGAQESDLQGFYGAGVSVNKHPLSTIYDPEHIEFTLVPKGPLIDGTTGKTLIIRPGKPHTIDYGYLRDIPLGRYQMSAVYKGDGQSVPLKIGGQWDETSEHRTSYQLDFEPESIWGNNIAIISYIE